MQKYKKRKSKVTNSLLCIFKVAKKIQRKQLIDYKLDNFILRGFVSQDIKYNIISILKCRIQTVNYHPQYSAGIIMYKIIKI